MVRDAALYECHSSRNIEFTINHIHLNKETPFSIDQIYHRRIFSRSLLVNTRIIIIIIDHRCLSQLTPTPDFAFSNRNILSPTPSLIETSTGVTPSSQAKWTNCQRAHTHLLQPIKLHLPSIGAAVRKPPPNPQSLTSLSPLSLRSRWTPRGSAVTTARPFDNYGAQSHFQHSIQPLER